MERQKRVSHMKEQNKPPKKEFTKMETSNIPDVEFKTLVIRILKELRRRVDKLSGNFNKEIKDIKMEKENSREPVRNEEYNI